jgi:hypothetical protein
LVIFTSLLVAVLWVNQQNCDPSDQTFFKAPTRGLFKKCSGERKAQVENLELRFFYRMKAEARNIWHIVQGKTSSFWDESYAAGYWEFLKYKSQRPRHYIVSGLVRDYAKDNQPEILEIGCGF